MAVSLDMQTVAQLAQWDRLGPDAESLAQSIEDDRFPGAIVPAIESGGNSIFYALADNGRAWRRLQPLLFAFAGPTITDFEGIPITLNKNEPIEKYFAALGVHTVAALRPGVSENQKKVAIKVLTSLQKSISRAPDLAVSERKTTSILLSHFQDAINGGDVNSARKILATLENDLHLDAQNLLNLEFQTYATSGDWIEIRNHPKFELACAVQQVPATAEILLETLYWSHFLEAKENRTPFKDESVVQICYSLLKCVENSESPIALKVKELLTDEEQKGFALANLVVSDNDSYSDINKTEDQVSVSDPLSHAKASFLAIGSSTNNDTYFFTMAKTAYESLAEDEQKQLLSSPQFNVIWSEIQEHLKSGQPPNDWIEWLNSLENPDFDAGMYARLAPVNWRLSDGTLDTHYVQKLVQALEGVTAGSASNRLSQSLPFLVDWAAKDPQWPRPSLRPFYLALLIKIAFDTRRGEKTIKSATLLIEGALRCGLNESEYRDVLDVIATVGTEAFSRYTAYDIFEFVDLALDFSAIDNESLLNTSAAVVEVANRHLNRMSTGQRAAYSQICARIGWETEIVDFEFNDEDPMSRLLSNSSIGIYTLTESAGRKASEILKSIAPNVNVELNHDHTATSALAAIVARVDIFVVAWASAKLAATNFIKSRRGSKPLIYATGKGASSLIRAIEEYSISANESVTNN